MRPLKIVLLTGISGSGKSVALRMLEDAGYVCVDNLPLKFLHEFINSMRDDEAGRVAVAIDVRSPGELTEIPAVITDFKSTNTEFRLIFLDADDETLVQRYSESRRIHPLSEKLAKKGLTASLEECIQLERDQLSDLRNLGHVIDTSGLMPGQLRAWIRDLIKADRKPLLLTFESFAFKEGVPRDADLVFDVRCLPNPHYTPALRPLTGKDQAVADWLKRFPDVGQMIDDIEAFIRKWLPRYTEDTRSYLTVAIGCTGGKHRSVYMVETLAQRFAEHQPLLIRHRNQPESVE
jgi:RNase adapter protein RapZ